MFRIGQEEKDAVARVIDSRQMFKVNKGPLQECANFEKEMREKYRERRDIMVKGFNDLGLDCIVPQGAFYAFPSIVSTGMSSTEFAENLLKSQRVAVVPGNAFGACGEGFIRCCYASSSEEIIEALKRIGMFLQSLKK